jgi:SH3 domain-containing YSC84-like protein 1
MGSGLVVARLADGSWSAPSAIFTTGAGFGGQIGAELTDFVFILNDAAAVRTFSQAGSITLGGNVSVAAGPIGRNAEAAGAASTRGVAGIFSYSKTKGLFAGVSLEGSVLLERKDANEKLYNRRITARDLLEGSIRPPPAADSLMRVLNSRFFASRGQVSQDDMYNDIPVYDDRHDDLNWEGRRGSSGGRPAATAEDYEYHDRPQRTSTWTDNVYDRPPNYTNSNLAASTRANPNETFDRFQSDFEHRRANTGFSNHSDQKPKTAPGRPTAPKPKFVPKDQQPKLGENQAVALFTFEPDQPGDLGFKKGEIITIIKRTDSKNDWWTGQIGDRTGIFPR